MLGLGLDFTDELRLPDDLPLERRDVSFIPARASATSAHPTPAAS
jgi:hypothetical protein